MLDQRQDLWLRLAYAVLGFSPITAVAFDAIGWLPLAPTTLSWLHLSSGFKTRTAIALVLPIRTDKAGASPGSPCQRRPTLMSEEIQAAGPAFLLFTEEEGSRAAAQAKAQQEW